MEKSTNSPFNQDVLQAIEEGVLTLSEVVGSIMGKLNNTLVSDIPLESLPLIKNFKTQPHVAETRRFYEVDQYLYDTSFLSNTSSKTTLQEVNGGKYLVLGQDGIFEVIEQKGPIFIAYHPVKDIYIVYRFLGESSDQNTCLLWGLNRIDETDIDGYYLVSSSHEEVFDYAGGFKKNEIRTEEGYYYIGENGETQYFGDFRSVRELRKHGNAVLFSGVSMDYYPNTVIHNGNSVKEIPSGFANLRESKSGRHLLQVFHDLGSNGSTSSLFDLDKMEFIFEGADKFSYVSSSFDDDVGIIEDAISWEFHKQRKGLEKIFAGTKITRQSIVL